MIKSRLHDIYPNEKHNVGKSEHYGQSVIRKVESIKEEK